MLVRSNKSNVDQYEPESGLSWVIVSKNSFTHILLLLHISNCAIIKQMCRFESYYLPLLVSKTSFNLFIILYTLTKRVWKVFVSFKV